MKGVVLFLEFLIILSNASAISPDLKVEYSQEETAIIKLSGKILEPIARNEVDFVRDGHVPGNFDYDIKKLGDNFYLWFITPQREGNYTLIIKDVFLEENGIRKTRTLEQNFKINDNLTDYSIKPGFIFSSENFYVTLRLFGENSISINTNFPENREIGVSPGDNRIEYSIAGVEGIKMTNISLGKYTLPAYIIGKKVETPECTANEDCEDNEECKDEKCAPKEAPNGDEDTAPEFNIFPKSIVSTILIGTTPLEVSPYPIEINNTGKANITQLEFRYDEGLFTIDIEDDILIHPGEKKGFNLILINTGQEIEEPIIIKSGNFSQVLTFKLNFTENEDEVNNDIDDNPGNGGFSCSAIDGIICTAGETCDGDTIETEDTQGEGSCCLGICNLKNKENKPVWGYIILAVLVLLVLFIILKYRKTKAETNPMKKYH